MTEEPATQAGRRRSVTVGAGFEPECGSPTRIPSVGRDAQIPREATVND